MPRQKQLCARRRARARSGGGGGPPGGAIAELCRLPQQATVSTRRVETACGWSGDTIARINLQNASACTRGSWAGRSWPKGSRRQARSCRCADAGEPSARPPRLEPQQRQRRARHGRQGSGAARDPGWHARDRLTNQRPFRAARTQSCRPEGKPKQRPGIARSCPLRRERPASPTRAGERVRVVWADSSRRGHKAPHGTWSDSFRVPSPQAKSKWRHPHSRTQDGTTRWHLDKRYLRRAVTTLRAAWCSAATALLL